MVYAAVGIWYTKNMKALIAELNLRENPHLFLLNLRYKMQLKGVFFGLISRLAMYSAAIEKIRAQFAIMGPSVMGSSQHLISFERSFKSGEIS